MQQIHTELPTVQHFVGIGEALPDFALDYEHLLKTSSPSEPPVDVREEDIQYLNLTSGTTGVPKSYLLTQYSNVVAAMTMAKEFEMVEKDVVLIVFPMFGRVGFVWTLLSIYMGTRQVIVGFQTGARRERNTNRKSYYHQSRSYDGKYAPLLTHSSAL